MIRLDLPTQIRKIVGNLSYYTDSIGRSEDSVLIYENKYILKISKDIKRLEDEFERTRWIYNKIPSAKPYLFIVENDKAYLLRECLIGKSLIDEKYLSEPLKLIKLIRKAVVLLRSLDEFNCTFNSKESIGKDFIHGDLCLPNIMFDDNEEFIGFIDLDNSGLGDRWFDYSWLLWSFEYNLKTDKYNKILLDELGIKMDVNKYCTYIPKEYILELKNVRK